MQTPYIFHMIDHLDNFISVLFFRPSWNTLDSNSITEPFHIKVLSELEQKKMMESHVLHNARLQEIYNVIFVTKQISMSCWLA